MKRLTWVVGPPAAGKTTWAERLRTQSPAPRILEFAQLLHPLVDPVHPRKGMMQAKSLFIRAIRQVELHPANVGLPPLVVIVALIHEEALLPLSEEEELILILPPRAQWERQFLDRSAPPSPGSRPMGLEEARGWYERYLRWRFPRTTP
ncbi:hypothetical protein CYFUS_001219 [Cystobacter fuscus]|uniref:Uncharacterized protein n=1 Tax=Cystobacter fuscus TaxID=43 RepID=A0A250IVN3_9BACT|nr:hypothetical protein CYFUS_001219 [Cystobacter fuscus]